MHLAIEERVDTLEIVLGEFIVSTNKAFLRIGNLGTGNM